MVWVIQKWNGADWEIWAGALLINFVQELNADEVLTFDVPNDATNRALLLDANGELTPLAIRLMYDATDYKYLMVQTLKVNIGMMRCTAFIFGLEQIKRKVYSADHSTGILPTDLLANITAAASEAGVYTISGSTALTTNIAAKFKKAYVKNIAKYIARVNFDIATNTPQDVWTSTTARTSCTLSVGSRTRALGNVNIMNVESGRNVDESKLPNHVVCLGVNDTGDIEGNAYWNGSGYDTWNEMEEMPGGAVLRTYRMKDTSAKTSDDLEKIACDKLKELRIPSLGSQVSIACEELSGNQIGGQYIKAALWEPGDTIIMGTRGTEYGFGSATAYKIKRLTKDFGQVLMEMENPDVTLSNYLKPIENLEDQGIYATDITGTAIESSSGENLLVNGAFEIDTDKDGTPDAWEPHVGVGFDEIVCDRDLDSYKGMYSAKVATSGIGALSQLVPVAPYRRYRLKLVAKGANGFVMTNGVAGIILYEGDAVTEVATIYVTDKSLTTSFKNFVLDVDLTDYPSARYARVLLCAEY